MRPSATRLTLGVATAILGAVMLSWAPAASATFPGENGKILFRKTGRQAGFWTVAPRSGELERIAKSRDGGDAQWGPNGKTFVYAEGGDIYLSRHGKKERVTSTPEPELAPSLSGPGGERIAYWTYDSEQPDNGGAQIWVMSRDGTNRRQITESNPDLIDQNPSFSPDGSLIAFDRRTSAPSGVDDRGVCVMRADGSDVNCLPEWVGSSFTPSFAPDGRSLTFVRDVNSGQVVVTFNLKSTRFREISPAYLHAENPAFSPNGKRIAYTGYGAKGQAIYVRDLRSERRTRLTPPRFDAHINPTLSWAAR